MKFVFSVSRHTELSELACSSVVRFVYQKKNTTSFLKQNLKKGQNEAGSAALISFISMKKNINSKCDILSV